MSLSICPSLSFSFVSLCISVTPASVSVFLSLYLHVFLFICLSLSFCTLSFLSLLLRFILDEPPGVQKLYLDSTPPPVKVLYLNDKEQKEWVKEVQGITEL